MLAYVTRRLLQAIPVVVVASVGVFLMIHLIPGDPAQVLAGPDASPEVVAAVRTDMGLDRPLPMQYGEWVAHVLRGDFGRSYTSRLPVAELIAGRLPATLTLTLAGVLLTVVIALPTGILAALHERRAADWLISALTGLALAIPNFWLGILAIIIFSLILGWLPPGGLADFSHDPGQALKYVLLPSVTLALQPAASLSRQVKASMLDVLYEDYVRTARAKGLPRAAVIVRHAFRTALVPVVTLLGLQVGRLLGGAVIVESVFAWPGVGRLILDAIGNRDYTVVQGGLLLLVMAFIVVNLLTDLLYGVLDPRIRLAGGRAR